MPASFQACHQLAPQSPFLFVSISLRVDAHQRSWSLARRWTVDQLSTNKQPLTTGSAPAGGEPGGWGLTPDTRLTADHQQISAAISKESLRRPSAPARHHHAIPPTPYLISSCGAFHYKTDHGSLVRSLRAFLGSMLPCIASGARGDGRLEIIIEKNP